MPEINYYTENSDVTLTQAPPTETAQAWRPGRAGLTERVAMGNGQGEGWLVYFYERYLIAELWASGAWLTSRHLDCTPLLRVGGSRHRNVVAFGWNKDANLLSLGCVTRDADRPQQAESVHADFYVPNLAHAFVNPPQVHLGGGIIAAGDQTQVRTLDAVVSPIAGRVCSNRPLTRGELARLSGREVLYAD